MMEELIAQLPKTDAFIQHFLPNFTNWLPFYWKNFQQTTRYTYRLAIDDPDAVYRHFSDKTRYKIRKANKIVTVREDLSAEQFHDVHQMTFDRQGLPTPFSLDLFLKFDKALEQHDARKMFFAVDQDQNIHSALYIIIDKEIAYMHFLGSNPTFRKSESVNFLYWHVIQYLTEQRGIYLIDFQGSMMKNVENIFRRLRATQVPYFSITQDNSRLFKWIQQIKN